MKKIRVCSRLPTPDPDSKLSIRHIEETPNSRLRLQTLDPDSGFKSTFRAESKLQTQTPDSRLRVVLANRKSILQTQTPNSRPRLQ